MRRQIDIFLTALMFFTRIPVPKRISHDAQLLQKSACYFPWVGWIVGLIAAGIYIACRRIFPVHISVLISMLASVFTTGAFHEDGFADVCDAFGGGWTKEKILLIMKDSRLGTYGVIGLFFMLGMKFLLMYQLLSLLNYRLTIWTIICAHSLSRLAAVTIIQQYKYVTDDTTSKSKPLANRKLIFSEFAFATIGGLLPFLFLPNLFLFSIILVVAGRLYLGYYFNKWIGGYTGDCLGATQQVCEVLFYLAIIVLWKFT